MTKLTTDIIEARGTLLPYDAECVGSSVSYLQKVNKLVH